MQTLTFVPSLLLAALVAPAGAHRARRGFTADVTGKVSNSGARPPETGFTLCCVRGGKIRVIVARLFHSLSFSFFFLFFFPLFFISLCFSLATDMHRIRFTLCLTSPIAAYHIYRKLTRDRDVLMARSSASVHTLLVTASLHNTIECSFYF